jgi:hypothetical protein
VVAGIGGHGLEEWRLLGCLGCFSVLSLGCPVTDLILCCDHSGERECVRFDLNGRETARVVGPRVFTKAWVPDKNKMLRQYEESELASCGKGEADRLSGTEAC